MQAGRELDALVATRVMGSVVSQDPIWQKVYEQPDAWVETSPSRQLRRTLQPYSTDIAVAWGVVEKMISTLFPPWDDDPPEYGTPHVYWCDDKWCAVFAYDCIRSAATAPHAICLAALKAVGVELTSP